jgi:hypothetical protein
VEEKDDDVAEYDDDDRDDRLIILSLGIITMGEVKDRRCINS